MQMTEAQAAHIKLIVKRGFEKLKENKKDGVCGEMGDSKPRFRYGEHAVCRFQHDPKHGGGLQAEFYDYGACDGGWKSARRIRGTYGTEKAWHTILDVLKLYHFVVATDLFVSQVLNVSNEELRSYDDPDTINYAIRMCKYELKNDFQEFIEGQKGHSKGAATVGPGKWYGSLDGLLRNGYHTPKGKVPEDEVQDLLALHELLLPNGHSGELPPLLAIAMVPDPPTASPTTSRPWGGSGAMLAVGGSGTMWGGMWVGVCC